MSACVTAPASDQGTSSEGWVERCDGSLDQTYKNSNIYNIVLYLAFLSMPHDCGDKSCSTLSVAHVSSVQKSPDQAKVHARCSTQIYVLGPVTIETNIQPLTLLQHRQPHLSRTIDSMALWHSILSMCLKSDPAVKEQWPWYSSPPHTQGCIHYRQYYHYYTGHKHTVLLAYTKTY